jgi:hypothetical protein
MTIEYIKIILNNRLVSLKNLKNQSEVTGDIDMVIKLDNEINELQITLNKLNQPEQSIE